MSEPFKVAVVGAGGMAREHVRAFAAVPGVSVAGLHSRTRSKAEAVAADLQVGVIADSVDELWQRTRADLVVVAVPELAANAVATACVRHDWAVLLEKPAGYDLADAQDIAAAAAAGRARSVMVGFNRRFYASTRAVKADLDQRPGHRFVHVQDQQSFAEARRYNHPEPVVQRFMYANSIHTIDLIAHLCRGSVDRVQHVAPWQGEATAVCLAHIAFTSGDTALYEGIWQGPGPWAATVSTTGRRWVMQPLEGADYQDAGTRTRIPLEPDPVDKAFKAGFRLQAEAAVRRAQGQPSDAVSLEESLRTMRLIHAIFGV